MEMIVLVSKNNKDYVIGELTDGMLHTVKDPEYSQSSIDTSPQICHQRLGPLNHGYIKKMMKKNMVKGMDNGRNEKAANNCEGCIGGNMHRNPSPQASQHTATKAHEVVHSDVCGPMQVESKGGS